MAEHTLSAEPTHSRWNRALKPRLTIAPGDVVHLECVDSSGAQVKPGMTVQQFLQIDRGRTKRFALACGSTMGAAASGCMA